MVNGLPFAPMLDAQASVEQTVRRHLNGIMHVMGSRYAISLILDDTMDASNSGVLSNSTDPWRAAVAAINAAAQAKPLDEAVRQQIGKALGLQATAVVTQNEASEELHAQNDRLRLGLLRLRAFCDEPGKAIITKLLVGDAVTDANHRSIVEDALAVKPDGVPSLLVEIDNAAKDAALYGRGTLHVRITADGALVERICPRCGGDCSAANPPVLDCPMR